MYHKNSELVCCRETFCCFYNHIGHEITFQISTPPLLTRHEESSMSCYTQIRCDDYQNLLKNYKIYKEDEAEDEEFSTPMLWIDLNCFKFIFYYQSQGWACMCSIFFSPRNASVQFNYELEPHPLSYIFSS